ncbi:ribosomal protection-like ABC-F family protein [Wukongibacter sp. M2B1]|uniref:ribosomal protection-like ABC-F family protein n=1 Tax=Wukongibacter sp. M2B1 TaxID=3088895 RepID=UPI003D7B07A5
MIEIGLKNVEKYYGANKVLEDISFEIQSGEIVGILGRNGTGKTTIFKIISKIESYDGGTLSIRKGATIGYLDQIPEYPEHYRADDVLNEAFRNVLSIKENLRSLESEMTRIEDGKLEGIMKKYGDLQMEYENSGGYEIEEKISKICTGLKIDNKFRERLFNTLSGGEKTTVMLGKILLLNPNILLLDEPTNHLDIESVEWLEEFLKEYKGTVLIISHDRYFLDAVVGKIVEIEKGKSNIYLGNYSYYIEEKERRFIQQLELYKSQQKKIKSMEEAIKRFKDWGNRGDNDKMFKKAASMQKRIDKMDKIDRPVVDKTSMKLDFSTDSRSGRDVIKVRDLEKRFGDKVILKDLDFHVTYSEKVAILGKNGCGKSTLLKILLNEVNADGGDVKIASAAKIGYLQQEIKFSNKEQTILETFREKHPVSEGEARSILARFSFYADDVFKKVKNLSGGEKVRLKLCQLMQSDINLLILDEPTNHLDIDSREMMEQALRQFNGTIIFISHDRYFINKTAHRIVEINNKKLVNYVGNYNYYREKRTKEKLIIEEKVNTKKVKRKDIDQNRTAIEAKKNDKRIKEIEEEIERLENQIQDMDIELSHNSDDYEKLAEIHEEKCILQQKLESLLEDWVKLSS